MVKRDGSHKRVALREQLSTHQVLTVRLPSPQRKASLTIRRDCKPEQVHRKIYKVLRMPERTIKTNPKVGS
jgi:hypothetical protein